MKPREEGGKKEEGNLTGNSPIVIFQVYRILEIRGCIGRYQSNQNIRELDITSLEKCNRLGTRMTQGLFVCKTCGEENADRNGI